MFEGIDRELSMSRLKDNQRPRGRQVPGDVEAVDLSHGDVEQDDIGPALPGQTQRGDAVRRLAHDVDPIRIDLLDQHRSPLPGRRLIVDNQHAHVHRWAGTASAVPSAQATER